MSVQKQILCITEKEQNLINNLMFGFTLKSKPQSEIEACKKKIGNYSNYLKSKNRSWVQICTYSRGKYRYKVSADCVEGFSKDGYRYPSISVEKAYQFLSKFDYKSDCCFKTQDQFNHLSMINADFTSFEDAMKFAKKIATLSVVHKNTLMAVK